MSEAFALPPPMTIAAFDQFLAVQQDDVRWELVDGQLLPLARASLDHAEIAGNIWAALRSAMPANRRWRVTTGGVRVQISDDSSGIHAPAPDVMAWHGTMDGTKNFVTTPLVIVEVLSPSNMDTDRGAKLRFYKTGLQTLRHIALVYQDQMRVECYHRTDLGWDLITLTRPGDAMMFPALAFEMMLADVYGGIAFPSV